MAVEHKLDQEYIDSITPLIPNLITIKTPPVDDIENRRRLSDILFDLLLPRLPTVTDVDSTTHVVRTRDDHQLQLFRFTKQGAGAKESKPTSAILYTHGGGFYGLSTNHYRKVLEFYVSRSGVPLISVDMRLAPEHPDPVPIEDCYEALTWLSMNAASLNIDPARIAVFGDSAGGGLAAGLAIKARDEGLSPPLAKQMMCSACLDDRTMHTQYPAFEGLLTWTTDDSVTAWRAYLGPDRAGDAQADVSPYAAPSRVKSVEGLPPSYIEVSSIDIVREENLAYAARMAEAGIETEVHCWPGLPHSFELFAFDIATAQHAIEQRVKTMKDL